MNNVSRILLQFSSNLIEEEIVGYRRWSVIIRVRNFIDHTALTGLRQELNRVSLIYNWILITEK